MFLTGVTISSSVCTGSASPGTMRDAMRRLLLTPVVDDLNKRSLLARIVKLYPEMQAMITGEVTPEREAVIPLSVRGSKRLKE